MDGMNDGMDMGLKAHRIWDANVQRGEIQDGQERAEEARNKDAGAMVTQRELEGSPAPAEKPSGLGGVVSSMFGGESEQPNKEGSDGIGGFVSSMFSGEPEQPKPEMTYEFGGKRYGSMDDARAEAMKELDSTDVYFDKQRDQIQQNIRKRTGDVERAEQFGLFMDDKKNRTALRHGADAYRRFAMGDPQGGVDAFNNSLKSGGMDWEIAGFDPVNGEDGSVLGYTLSMQGKLARGYCRRVAAANQRGAVNPRLYCLRLGAGLNRRNGHDTG